MKKKLMILAIVSLSGCGISDRVYTSVFTYHNDTDLPISISINIPPLDTPPEEQFTILPNGSHELRFSLMSDGFPGPFSYQGDGPNYKVIVSNGIKEIEFNNYDQEGRHIGIFDISTYTIDSTKGGTRYYSYTFHSDFFED